MKTRDCAAPFERLRRLDTRISAAAPERRRILVDARTPVNFTMVAPVVRALAARSAHRVLLHRQRRAAADGGDLPRGAGRTDAPSATRAALMKFDAYVASDFMWASLPRGTARIQVFHGVGGKYGFDAPDRSMREWHRLFFVNERRLRNFVAAGAIDADSPAIRLVGMPKVDCLVDGSIERERVLQSLGPRPVAADGALRADLVAGLVAERDRASSSSPARADAGQPDRQAARSIARSPRALLGRRRLGCAARSRCWPPGSGAHRARPRHLAVSRRGGPDDHRPQLAPASSSCCGQPTRPHPPARS